MAHWPRAQLSVAFSVAMLSACALTAPSSSAAREELSQGPRTVIGPQTARDQAGVSILVYHRFGGAVSDAMTVRTTTFRWQLDYLKDHHHPVVPLRTLISWLLGQSPPPPPGAVAITVDDGHLSVFTEMWPVVHEYNVPVTLFVYPSAISNASYAMTWQQLAALHRTGLFDVQSHTYWHPNFRIEKRRLSSAAYQVFASTQLVKAKTVLEGKLGGNVDLIAWPFGIYDDELIALAREAGYSAGVTLDRRMVTPRESTMALPRFLVTDSRQGFASMVERRTTTPGY